MTVIEPSDIRLSPAPERPLGYPTREDERPPDGEAQSIARVVESLVVAFPSVPEPYIRDCVQRIRAGFASAPIRTYIPILVARQARAALIDCSSTEEGAASAERRQARPGPPSGTDRDATGREGASSHGHLGSPWPACRYGMPLAGDQPRDQVFGLRTVSFRSASP